MESVLSVILCIAAIAFYFWLLVFLPRNMAKKRGRNPVGWTILFWILTPFWGSIILLVLGDSKKKIKQEILDAINNQNSNTIKEL